MAVYHTHTHTHTHTHGTVPGPQGVQLQVPCVRGLGSARWPARPEPPCARVTSQPTCRTGDEEDGRPLRLSQNLAGDPGPVLMDTAVPSGMSGTKCGLFQEIPGPGAEVWAQGEPVWEGAPPRSPHALGGTSGCIQDPSRPVVSCPHVPHAR